MEYKANYDSQLDIGEVLSIYIVFVTKKYVYKILAVAQLH